LFPFFEFRYAAVYLTAGLENLLEEIILQCLPSESDTVLTATMFEHAIASNGDLWGLLQPYAHLNAGRIASGECHFDKVPYWVSVIHNSELHCVVTVLIGLASQVT
jgi:ankyrin repeat/BTB/POZ domain-containing protein 2